MFWWLVYLFFIFYIVFEFLGYVLCISLPTYTEILMARVRGWPWLFPAGQNQSTYLKVYDVNTKVFSTPASPAQFFTEHKTVEKNQVHYTRKNRKYIQVFSRMCRATKVMQSHLCERYFATALMCLRIFLDKNILKNNGMSQFWQSQILTHSKHNCAHSCHGVECSELTISFKLLLIIFGGERFLQWY